jgi:hypothetical protein
VKGLDATMVKVVKADERRACGCSGKGFRRGELVCGAWCMVHGAWCMVHGAWCMNHPSICSVLSVIFLFHKLTGHFHKTNPLYS